MIKAFSINLYYIVPSFVVTLFVVVIQLLTIRVDFNVFIFIISLFFLFFILYHFLRVKRYSGTVPNRPRLSDSGNECGFCTKGFCRYCYQPAASAPR
jgi:hypothetical protein